MSFAGNLELAVAKVLGSAPVENGAAEVTAFLLKMLAGAGEIACPVCGVAIGTAEAILSPIVAAEAKQLVAEAAAKLEAAGEAASVPPPVGEESFVGKLLDVDGKRAQVTAEAERLAKVKS